MNQDLRMSDAKLYVGNISSRTSRSDIQYKFEKYGPLRRCDLMNGFAFVEYEDHEDARYAVKKMNGARV